METKDVMLKKGQFEDWKALYRNVWSRPEAAKYMVWKITTTEEDARARMERTIRYQETHDTYLVYEKDLCNKERKDGAEMETDFRTFITGLQHVGIPTNNIEETIRFYETLGFDVVYQTVNEKADEKVAFLRWGDVTIETYENKKAAFRNGAIDHIALNVTDIETVYELAVKHGFHSLEKGIQFLPFWDYGVRFFTITGPNREKVEFSQYLTK